MAATNIEIKVLWRATAAEFVRIDRSTDRATMFAVRQGGRRVRQEARRAAPVYKGGARMLRKKQQGPWTSPNRPINGLLRASINSAKQLGRRGEGTYSVRVAPRGERVHLYTGKIEEQVGYMAKGYDAVNGEMSAIAAAAWVRSTRSRGGRSR